MKSVFADTLYWGAVVNPKDQYHSQAMAANKKLVTVRFVSTEEVLTEFLDSLADRGSHLRAVGSAAVRRMMGRKNALIVPQSHDSFLAGLSLYERRADKGYSLVDCISMETMRRKGIREVLTNDRHFEQEGFVCLLR